MCHCPSQGPATRPLTRTARAAAEALDVSPAEIANSLVFVATTHEGEHLPLLVLASGGHRVDVDKVADLAGLAHVEQADPDYVREHTGFAIGGVAPVGHPQHIRTIIDVTLGRYETVWAAAGHSHSVFATSYDELIQKQLVDAKAKNTGTPDEMLGDLLNAADTWTIL